MEKTSLRPVACATLLLGILLTAQLGFALSVRAAEQTCLPESGSAEKGDVKVSNPERSLELASFAFSGAIRVLSATVPNWARQPTYEQLKTRAISYVRSNPSSALILYSGDDDYICAFIWSATTILSARPFLYVRMKNKRGTIETLSRQLRSRIIGRHSEPSRMPVRRREASPLTANSGPMVSLASANEARRRLSELFFPLKFRHLLRNVQNVSLISIRGMSEVPAAALQPFDDGRYAVDLFSINYLAFPSELNEPLATWQPKFDRPLIVGNPYPAQDPEWDFPNLPGAEKEAEHVGRIFGGKPLLRGDAKLEAFHAQVTQANYIHIAAHALSDPKKPKENGFIRFSDQRLPVLEAQWLRLRRQRPLVVLSACQTATGRIEEAGIVGMGRAFQAAGARNTVMSLWSIDDDATLALMKAFVAEIKKHPPSEAMRRAMLATRTRFPNPRQWAAFNVFGVHAIEHHL